MTGPEHSDRAEELLRYARGDLGEDRAYEIGVNGWFNDEVLRMAQAHATLALVDAVRRAPGDVGAAVNRSVGNARRERQA